MKRIPFLGRACLLFFVIIFSFAPVSARGEGNKLQNVIHLLDYLAKDYPGAVRDGEILDIAEYTEMLEFSSRIFDIAQEIHLPSESRPAILADLKNLKSLVENKSPGEKIKELAEKAKWAIINATGYKVTPLTWPDEANGHSLYVQNCLQCHGPKGGGDGNLARDLKPAPTNFLNDSLAARMSPFTAYNTIKLGVKGTAMPAFSHLTDKEAWDLAFYIKSLRFTKQKTDSVSLRKIFDDEYVRVSLKSVAISSDEELINKFGHGAQAEIKLKALRTLSPSEQLAHSGLALAREYLHQAIT
ncbi:MAG: c-type cytochrome, partial [Gillisia sp.]